MVVTKKIEEKQTEMSYKKGTEVDDLSISLDDDISIISKSIMESTQEKFMHMPTL